MLDEDEKVLLWYIDMIAKQGIDVDGVPYFDDLYLGLVVYPDGIIIVDDMDELEGVIGLIKGRCCIQRSKLEDIGVMIRCLRKFSGYFLMLVQQ